MLNQQCKVFARPHFEFKRLVPFDPWNSKPFIYFNFESWKKEIQEKCILQIESGSMTIRWYLELPLKVLFSKAKRFLKKIN